MNENDDNQLNNLEGEGVQTITPLNTNVRKIRFRKDHGYAWFVLLCTTTVTFLANTIWTSFSVYIVEFREQYPDKTQLFVGMISVFFGVCGVTALVASSVVNNYSPRAAAVAGFLMIGVGYLIGAFSPNPYILFMSFGILLGSGMTFTDMASTVATQQYFEKRRSLANGILLAGNSLSMFAAPPLAVVLISSFGWRGAFLIQGATLLHGLPISLLIRPPTPERNITVEDMETSSGTSKAKFQLYSRFFDCIRKTCACSLYRDVPFLLLMLASVLFEFSHQTPLVFSVSRAVSLGISRQNASFIMTAWAIASICGRIAFGWLGDKVSRGFLLATCLTCAGIILLASLWCFTFPLQLTYGIIYGLAVAGYFVTLVPLMIDMLGIENLPSALSVNILFGGMSGFLGPIASNYITESTGNFNTSFIMVGVCDVFSGIVLYVAAIYNRCISIANKRHTQVEFADTEYTEIKLKNDARQSGGSLQTHVPAST